MATAQPSKEVTTAQVGSVSFGWYSDDEARSKNSLYTAAGRPMLVPDELRHGSGGGGMHMNTRARHRRYES